MCQPTDIRCSICFHVVIVDIFRPYLQDQKPYILRSFFSRDATPDAIFKASLNQLKRLALVSVLNFPPVLYCSLTGIATLHVAAAVLDDRSDPDWRSYFLLSMRINRDLYICYPVFKQITQGTLAMAIKTGAITSSEATSMMKQLEEIGKYHQTSESVVGSFMIDFKLALTNQTEAQAQAMALEFDALSLFDQFTHGEYANLEAEGQPETN